MSRLQLVLVLTSVLNSKLQYTYKNELRNIPFHATYVWVVCTLHNILLNYSSELIQVLPSFLSSRYSVSVCTILSLRPLPPLFFFSRIFSPPLFSSYPSPFLLLPLNSSPRSRAYQAWEFAHRFSKRINHFLRKNERMSDSLKKTSDSLIGSFLMSNLSKSLMVAHFL